MPYLPKEAEGTAPEGSHLAVITDATGLATAIPRGAVLLLVEDPKRADGVFPMVLLKVSRRSLVFGCACGEPSCTRRYSYNLAKGLGHHKPKAKQQDEKLGLLLGRSHLASKKTGD